MFCSTACISSLVAAIIANCETSSNVTTNDEYLVAMLIGCTELLTKEINDHAYVAGVLCTWVYNW